VFWYAAGQPTPPVVSRIPESWEKSSTSGQLLTIYLWITSSLSIRKPLLMSWLSLVAFWILMIPICFCSVDALIWCRSDLVAAHHPCILSLGYTSTYLSVYHSIKFKITASKSSNRLATFRTMSDLWCTADRCNS
jgi:hypothetical protein